MTAVRTGTGLDEDAAVAVWQAAQAGRGERSGGARAQRLRQRLRSPHALLLLAERDGVAVGVLLAEIAQGGLQVGLVAVAPSAQRSGVGTALLTALTARYPRASAVPDGEAAEALLHRAGFRPAEGRWETPS